MKEIKLLEVPKTKHQLRDPILIHQCIVKINEIIEQVNGYKANRKTGTSVEATTKQG